MYPPSHPVDAILLQSVPRNRDHRSQVRQTRPQSIYPKPLTLALPIPTVFHQPLSLADPIPQLSLNISPDDTDSPKTLTWLLPNCLVLAAQNRSLGLVAFQIFKSPTCGPSGVVMRQTWPAGTIHAFPERMGRMNDSVRLRECGCVDAIAV